MKFSSLITQYGDTAKAEEMCEKMRSACELPGVMTFNSSGGGGFAKQGEVKKADEVFEKMKSASKRAR